MSDDISAGMRLFVLARDRDACRMCGHGRTDPDPYDRRRNVRIGVERRYFGNLEDPDNLWVLCNNCSEGRLPLESNTTPDGLLLLERFRPRRRFDRRIPRHGTTDARAELAVELYERMLSDRHWGLDRAWLVIASLLMTCDIWRGEWLPFHDAPVLWESSAYRLTQRGEPNAALAEALRVKQRLANELGVGEQALCGEIGRFFRHPDIIGLQPNNPRGHAFRSLVAETLARFGDPDLVVSEAVSPRDLFPDRETGDPHADTRIDIVVQRGPRLVALIATQWTYRHGRTGLVGSLRAHMPAARRQNAECRFYGVTAEFVTARLRKVIEQTAPAAPNAAIDRLVHLQPELAGALIGRDGGLDRMWSLEAMVRASDGWR